MAKTGLTKKLEREIWSTEYKKKILGVDENWAGKIRFKMAQRLLRGVMLIATNRKRKESA